MSIMSKIGYSIRALLAMYESEIELWSTSRARASFKDLQQQARFRSSLCNLVHAYQSYLVPPQ